MILIVYLISSQLLLIFVGLKRKSDGEEALIDVIVSGKVSSKSDDLTDSPRTDSRLKLF